MNRNANQFAALQQPTVEAAMAVFKCAFDTAERLAALNLNTLRAGFVDATAGIQAAVDVKDPQALVALQAGLLQPAAERALSYYRSSYEILTQGCQEAVKPFEAGFAQMNKTVAAELEKAAGAAPVGSEAAVAAVKSSVAAANSTFDQVNRATRQVIEMAEANLAAATDAAVKAVATKAAPKARKTA
jgi:phasin family protein